MDPLSDESSFSRRWREKEEGRHPGGNTVLWIAAIAVLIGLNFGSWSFCMWVFGQPEHPMNYELLTRLDKLDPLRGFSPVGAPRGEFHSPKELYAELYSFGAAEFHAYNGILKRRYIQNYESKEEVAYLSGEFEVTSVQRFGKDDLYDSGIGIRARSTAFPDAIVDLALPSPEPPEKFDLAPGDLVRLEESTMCAAVLHVERLPDETMVFTAVPLVTKLSPGGEEAKTYRFAEGAAIAVAPQERIRIGPEHWPITAPAESIPAKPVEAGEETGEAADEAAGESREEGGTESADGERSEDVPGSEATSGGDGA